jgi:hypothetical protein
MRSFLMSLSHRSLRLCACLREPGSAGPLRCRRSPNSRQGGIRPGQSARKPYETPPRGWACHHRAPPQRIGSRNSTLHSSPGRLPENRLGWVIEQKFVHQDAHRADERHRVVKNDLPFEPQLALPGFSRQPAGRDLSRGFCCAALTGGPSRDPCPQITDPGRNPIRES